MNNYQEMKDFAVNFAEGKKRDKKINILKESFMDMLDETDCTYADLAIMTAVYQELHGDSGSSKKMFKKLLDKKVNESNK